MKTILIIEDDPAIVLGIKEGFGQQQYKILSTSLGEDGLKMARRENIDLIILDLILPDIDGTDVCKEIRKQEITTPVLVLSSRQKELDKVLLLEIGADDYVTKPFSLRELEARVKAILRRDRELLKDIDEYSFGNVHIDFKKQLATKQGKDLKFSSREFAVLKYLIQNEGEVVTRDMLLNEVWGYETFPSTRTVDNYVLSLRKKVEDDHSAPEHIQTVHTSGYRFVK
ncbi:MAG: response regulator transcription factor [Ignavibacteria bacterium]|nr:response regulator transcription factor [Ignavibacteria bacterium]